MINIHKLNDPIRSYRMGLFVSMEKEIEVWKDVLDYEGYYQASNLGRVRSLERTVTTKQGIVLSIHSCIRKLVKVSGGYYQVGLYRNGKTEYCYVNKLIWETFNGKTELQVDHIIENDKANNRLDNLQLLTCRQNASKNRLSRPKSSKYVGVYLEKNNRPAKWKAQICINGRVRNIGRFTTEELASEAYQKVINSL